MPATAAATATAAPAGPGGVTYVTGSSRKVCQLVGETDLELNTPTTNQTASRWGLVGDDLGYSFEHDGRLFFFFGDSTPTRLFKGQPNSQTSPGRSPDDNDAIAYTTAARVGAPGSGACPPLTFIHTASGAYQNPVVRTAPGQPAVTLGNFEIPIAGVSDGGQLYGFFITDRNQTYATRAVVAVSGDDAQTFRYLYDFSQGQSAKFINLAAAQAADGYLYLWGAAGGDLYRKSPPYLARKRAGSLGQAAGFEYFHGLNPDGTPNFLPGENSAIPLFHDNLPDAAGQPQTADCMGEHGVTWNPFLGRWLMLYNCLNNTPANPRGVYARVAAQPWGPWSAPQTIFNPQRDGGYCHFIHRAVTSAQPACDSLAPPDRVGDSGGEYAPYVIARYTTGDAAQGTTTLVYTLSTWIPYTEVIMQSTLRRAP